MLDFSQRNELSLLAAAIADVQAAAVALATEPLIVGAFARDLHLVYAHAIPVVRQTEDLDLAFAVPHWAAFEQLRTQLMASGKFEQTRVAHRLRYGAMPIDLVPFGPVESAARKIAWPPRGDFVMDVFGFREAQRSAVHVLLPRQVQSRVVSLPALALLKLVCWQDRRATSPRKDASDLHLITVNYLQAGNEQRLWSEFPAWTQDDEFDYVTAGARMLGHDVRKLLDAEGRGRIAQLLAAQSSAESPGPLAWEMDQAEPERPRRLLAAMLRGLEEANR